MANIRSIDYVAKDFDSIVDALISFATVNFGPTTNANRQWTDFNADDFSRTWLELLAYVGDLIFFYLDIQATQSNLVTATIRKNVLDIAKQFGFVVSTASSASGVAKFSLSAPGTIPVGFRVSAENGQEFFTSSSSPIPGSTIFEIFLPVVQGVQREETFIARGVQNEEITLGVTGLVIDTTNPISSLISPSVIVNADVYELVNTFIRSFPTDKHFRVLVDPEGRAIIRFGDGIFGKQLTPNDAIEVDYRTGGGAAGNIPANTLVTLLDASSFVSAVSNDTAFSGGADEPSLAQLKELVPASLRTLERAVTTKDYADIILVNFNSVSKASAANNISDPGVDVDIFVVPSGNSITKITDNLPLFNAISDFIDERKPVTTVFKILDAFGMDALLKIVVFLSAGASRSLVQSNMTTALDGFFSFNSGDVDGTGTKFAQKVRLNDLYDLISAIEGIERFEITKLHYRPRVEPLVALGTNYLISEVEVFQNAESSEWLIGANSNIDTPNFNSYTVFKKFPGRVSNLSEGSLADDTLNFSVVESTATGINIDGTTNILFDLNKTFLVDEFVGGTSVITLSNLSGFTFDHIGSSFIPRVGDRVIQGGNTARIISVVDSDTFVVSNGFPLNLVNGAATLKRDEFLLVDASGNVWAIEDNDAHSLVLSAFAINNTIVSDVSGGAYKIVRSLIGKNLIFHDLIFAGIEYNNSNTIFRASSSFNLVGTIGDEFFVSEPQDNIGDFGLPLTLDDFTPNTPAAGYGEVHCAGNADLSTIIGGPSSNFVLIDTNLNVYEIVSINNLAKTIVILHDATVTPAPAVGLPLGPTSTGKAASAVKRYYSDDNEVSFVIGLGNRPSGLGFQAVGAISFAVRDVPTSGAIRFANVVTLNTVTPHPFVVGQTIQVANMTDGTFNGTFVIVTTPTSSALTYAQIAADATSGDGNISLTGANIADGTLLKLKDSTANPETTFEFNKTGGVAFGNVAITYADASDSAALKSAVISAVNGAPSLGITATDGTGLSGPDEVVFLQNDNTGSDGNQGIVDTIAEPGVTIAGMSGGIGSGHSVPTPVIPNPGDNVTDLGISSDGTTVDHFEFRISGFVDDIVNLRNSEIPQVDDDDIELDFRGGVT